MLSVKNVQQYYGGSHILRDVSLDVAPGQVTVVLGRNGVGKTTLLKSLMGLVPIQSGTVEFDGQSITQATPYQRAGQIWDDRMGLSLAHARNWRRIDVSIVAMSASRSPMVALSGCTGHRQRI